MEFLDNFFVKIKKIEGYNSIKKGEREREKSHKNIGKDQT